jgi:hypothetical protein
MNHSKKDNFSRQTGNFAKTTLEGRATKVHTMAGVVDAEWMTPAASPVLRSSKAAGKWKGPGWLVPIASVKQSPETSGSDAPKIVQSSFEKQVLD